MAIDKEDTKKTKVLLPYNYFFIVDTDSFNLYGENNNYNTTSCLGYYNNLTNLVNKVIQLIVNDKKEILELKEFLKLWKEVSEEVGEYTSKIKF